MKDNIIYGKTTDGRDITLDGYRVESFTHIGETSVGEIVEVVFKSGQTIRVVSVEDDKGDSLWSGLVYVSQLKIPAPSPSTALTDFTKIDGSYGLFDRNAVEFLISWKMRGPNDSEYIEHVELHFASGKSFTVFANSIELGGDYSCFSENVVDDFIFMYEKSKQ
jgi:hypothetical protein